MKFCLLYGKNAAVIRGPTQQEHYKWEHPLQIMKRTGRIPNPVNNSVQLLWLQVFEPSVFEQVS